MRRILASVVFLVVWFQPGKAQINTSATDSILRAYALGNSIAVNNANSEAYRELLRRQAELLKTQTQALQIRSYTQQELQDAINLLVQRHPDSVEFLKGMDGKTPSLMPMKDLSAYDYVLALYAFSKEKKADGDINKNNAEAKVMLQLLSEHPEAIQQLLSEHPDLMQYTPAIAKLVNVFPQEVAESVHDYLERLYRIAKQ